MIKHLTIFFQMDLFNHLTVVWKDMSLFLFDANFLGRKMLSSFYQVAAAEIQGFEANAEHYLLVKVETKASIIHGSRRQRLIYAQKAYSKTWIES